MNKDDFLENVWLFFDKWGLLIGLVLVFAPPLYDVFAMGFRNYFCWKISHWGISCQLSGGFMILGWWISKVL